MVVNCQSCKNPFHWFTSQPQLCTMCRLGNGNGIVGMGTAACCACAGSCSHVGPHSYCMNHGTAFQPSLVTLQPQVGWLCGKCNRSYSPSVSECWPCNALVQIGGSIAQPIVTQQYTVTSSEPVAGEQKFRVGASKA